MKAIVIKSDGTFFIEQIRKGYREKRKLVGGDIECITLDTDFKMQMIINETGKLDHLPHNELATNIFRSYFVTADWIAGDVVICGCDNEGASCDLTDEQIAEIEEKVHINLR